jgi:acetylornithine deacetylase/succinyl-diaminopimelate desuccinylase-like protein
MRVEEILAELVAIDSTSSRPNVEIVTHLAARAEGLGLCARLFPYTDEQGLKKLQLVAVHPKEFEDGGHVELALVGHTDTVNKPQNPFILGLFQPTAALEKTYFRPAFTQVSHNL